MPAPQFAIRDKVYYLKTDTPVLFEVAKIEFNIATFYYGVFREGVRYSGINEDLLVSTPEEFYDKKIKQTENNIRWLKFDLSRLKKERGKLKGETK